MKKTNLHIEKVTNN